MFRFITVLMIALGLCGVSFAQEPAFLPGGVQTSYTAAKVTIAPATYQITSGTQTKGWLLGISYHLLAATSELKVKDGAPNLKSAQLAKKSPLFIINNSSGKTEHIEFKFPRYFSNGLVLEASGALVNLEWVTEANRRKLPFN
jgi:hypothetical protein